MGYQESFVQFRDVEVLKSEIRTYQKRNKEQDLAEVICLDRVKKAISPFQQGEIIVVVGGERSEQRSVERLKEGLGIGQVKNIVFIDNPNYYTMAKGDLHRLLEEHFEPLSDEEYQQLIS